MSNPCGSAGNAAEPNCNHANFITAVIMAKPTPIPPTGQRTNRPSMAAMQVRRSAISVRTFAMSSLLATCSYAPSSRLSRGSNPSDAVATMISTISSPTLGYFSKRTTNIAMRIILTEQGSEFQFLPITPYFAASRSLLKSAWNPVASARRSVPCSTNLAPCSIQYVDRSGVW